jgi:hypothetical protein
MDTPPNVNPLLEQLLRDREIIDIRVNGNQCCRMCFCQPEAEWTINKRSPSQVKPSLMERITRSEESEFKIKYA